ncbi:MAG TPA: metallophosphoesterase [Myxococcaceae bacterium]|nr:metallophosphoesterase [Myxococcaceae bacterium]
MKVRVAAVGDLHCREHDHGRFRHLIKQINESADILFLCGDLTDHGSVAEARVLAEELSALRVPCAAVLGNHDYECGHSADVVQELSKAKVRCLDGDSFIFEKVLGVVGVKGFGGGFGRGALQAFGEGPIKAFVQEAVNESLKLESALGRLETQKKVVLTHYSPVVGTVEGEGMEIRPFLGSSRLERPVDEYGADVVFHGHAHHGTPQGKTERGVPVYNVAMPLLAKISPERRFVTLEL